MINGAVAEVAHKLILTYEMGERLLQRCSTCEATFASRLTGSKSHWMDTSTFSCPTGKNLMIDGEKMVILYGYMLFGLKKHVSAIQIRR